MTPEIELLRSRPGLLEPVQAETGFELVDPSWDEASDTSYLSDFDRENPDIMANVEAMAETNALITWFGREDEQDAVGLWCGPEGTPLDRAPVVVLDTEGQYYLASTTVGDYLLWSAGREAFDAYRIVLADAGLRVSASWTDLDAAVPSGSGPQEYRDLRYREHRATRGLGS